MSKETIYREMPVEIESIGQQEDHHARIADALRDRIIRFAISDESVDRYRSIISVSGWDITAFRSNPMFLFGHNYGSPAMVMGRAVAIKKDMQRKKLIADTLFAPAEINPVAEMVFQMYKHKPPFMNAVSVGFIPEEMEEVSEEENKKAGKGKVARIRYKKQELLEYSAVTVPANPNALVDKAIQCGMDPVLVMDAKTHLPEVGDHDEFSRMQDRMHCWIENGEYECEYTDSSSTKVSVTVPDLSRIEMVDDEHEQHEHDEHHGHEEGGTQLDAVPSYKAGRPNPKATWNGSAARRRIRKWASSDGSGDKDTINWSKYGSAFAYFDAEDRENFGSYKLPHHDIENNEFTTVWGGVRAAMNALAGGRGGADVPSGEKRAVYNHLARHYKQFDKEPPELKAVGSNDYEVFLDEYESDTADLMDQIEEMSERVMVLANGISDLREFIDEQFQDVLAAVDNIDLRSDASEHAEDPDADDPDAQDGQSDSIRSFDEVLAKWKDRNKDSDNDAGDTGSPDDSPVVLKFNETVKRAASK